MSITNAYISETTQHLTEILTALQTQPGIEQAMLCTTDGLIVNGLPAKTASFSAVSGFIISAAKLSSNLLGLNNCEEVTLEFADGDFLVCRLFGVGDLELILSIRFNQKIAYKRMLGQTIQAVQGELED